MTTTITQWNDCSDPAGRAKPNLERPVRNPETPSGEAARRPPTARAPLQSALAGAGSPPGQARAPSTAPPKGPPRCPAMAPSPPAPSGPVIPRPPDPPGPTPTWDGGSAHVGSKTEASGPGRGPAKHPPPTAPISGLRPQPDLAPFPRNPGVRPAPHPHALTEMRSQQPEPPQPHLSDVLLPHDGNADRDPPPPAWKPLGAESQPEAEGSAESKQAPSRARTQHPREVGPARGGRALGGRCREEAPPAPSLPGWQEGEISQPAPPSGKTVGLCLPSETAERQKPPPHGGRSRPPALHPGRRALTFAPRSWWSGGGGGRRGGRSPQPSGAGQPLPSAPLGRAGQEAPGGPRGAGRGRGGAAATRPRLAWPLRQPPRTSFRKVFKVILGCDPGKKQRGQITQEMKR
uniref:proline-rich protein HaeIII subfamily 1-like n=1 Tax=Euleptes europaea TaxID=460621 RepID=UPI00253F7438|nr:proline-rich protein HaeIII subfamily 1-like [Euleptes europaea]